jgi:CDP-glucose 4,6-dehydratase
LNFGPDPSGACSVAELVDRFTAAFGGKPGWETRDVSHSVPETAELRLDATLAKETLGWLPRLTLDETVRWTADWYEASAAGKDARDLALGQIAAYEALL